MEVVWLFHYTSNHCELIHAEHDWVSESSWSELSINLDAYARENRPWLLGYIHHWVHRKGDIDGLLHAQVELSARALELPRLLHYLHHFSWIPPCQRWIRIIEITSYVPYFTPSEIHKSNASHAIANPIAFWLDPWPYARLFLHYIHLFDLFDLWHPLVRGIAVLILPFNSWARISRWTFQGMAQARRARRRTSALSSRFRLRDGLSRCWGGRLRQYLQRHRPRPYRCRWHQRYWVDNVWHTRIRQLCSGLSLHLSGSHAWILGLSDVQFQWYRQWCNFSHFLHLGRCNWGLFHNEPRPCDHCRCFQLIWGERKDEKAGIRGLKKSEWSNSAARKAGWKWRQGLRW